MSADPHKDPSETGAGAGGREDLLPVEDALACVLREAGKGGPALAAGTARAGDEGFQGGEGHEVHEGDAGEDPGPGRLATETVFLADALGRVLAETVLAPADLPPFDRSAMDGYALCAEDVGGVPLELDVVGFLPAGASADGLLVKRGQAVRIMTGAPIPAGASAVQMVERTEPLREGSGVRILAAVRAGENVLRQGEDLARGAVVLDRGAWIRAAEIGALACAGRTRVNVYRLPTANVLSTGDEIVDPSAEPLPHQIRNSNGPALAALLVSAGLRDIRTGLARDDPADLDRRIREGLQGDLLLIIGGVSMGDKDLVAAHLRAAGVQVLFHRIAMKPGKPLLFGRRGGCLVFGLPGNPLSALTDGLIFVIPAVQALMGLPPTGLAEISARTTEELRQKPGRTWYRLARITLTDGGFRATPVRSTGSGDLVSATRANGFLIMPADVARIPAGADVRARLWPGFELHA